MDFACRIEFELRDITIPVIEPPVDYIPVIETQVADYTVDYLIVPIIEYSPPVLIDGDTIEEMIE